MNRRSLDLLPELLLVLFLVSQHLVESLPVLGWNQFCDGPVPLDHAGFVPVQVAHGEGYPEEDSQEDDQVDTKRVRLYLEFRDIPPPEFVVPVLRGGEAGEYLRETLVLRDSGVGESLVGQVVEVLVGAPDSRNLQELPRCRFAHLIFRPGDNHPLFGFSKMV